MHLWPSGRIRDSFKIDYLRNLEWNLHRMNSEKKKRSQQRNSNQQSLLDDGNNVECSRNEIDVIDRTSMKSTAAKVGREILMLITSVLCCFGCADFVDQEEG